MKQFLSVIGLLTLTLTTLAEPTAKENPTATNLLAAARAARASWAGFPGFTADVEINQDGKLSQGKLDVLATGAVTLDIKDDSLAWAQRSLSSIVGHRMPSRSTTKTPCAFVDENTTHPLGRAVRPLDDEYHSSYRIQGPVITVVNRQQGESRFTITSLETKLTAEKKVLPVSYIVDTWNLKSGMLESSEAHRQAWVRVGSFDLPASALTVDSRTGKQQTRSITLTNHKLK